MTFLSSLKKSQRSNEGCLFWSWTPFLFNLAIAGTYQKYVYKDIKARGDDGDARRLT